MKFIKLTQGKHATVDDADYEWLNQWKWQALVTVNGSYAVRVNSAGKSTRMHRLIMGTPIRLVIDHKNHRTLDNRRQNLRTCTQTENMQNKRPNRGRKFKGAYRDKKKWRSQIMCEGVMYCLGSHNTEEQAARAYDEKAKELHGQFAYLNFP